MPRPGPRPYECVKRAWHSERHKPMRGSIIQRILRVAAEAHSPVTRKNREWQTKFPSVVMKAEEILYSKANSEAEYMDPDTLWERLNDAIDTIIRRDESTETGQFIQPCIEAALVLGCVPVKASRSEQHKNPRIYLNPKSEEPAQAAQPIADRTNNHTPPSRPPIPPKNQSTKSKDANQPISSSFFNTQITPSNSNIAAHSSPHSQANFPRSLPSMAIESNKSLNYGSVYPLYYGSHFQNVESHIRLQSPQNSEPKDILIGRPVGWPSRQPAYVASTMNLLPGASAEMTTGELRPVKSVDSHGKTAEMDCDLSLRLGPVDPCPIITEKALKAHVSEDGCSSSQQESSENRVKNLEFCFFPGSSASDPPKSCNDYTQFGPRLNWVRGDLDVGPESCNDKVENVGGFQDKNENSRKRKTQDDHLLDSGSIQWLKDHQPGQFDGKSRWPGL